MSDKNKADSMSENAKKALSDAIHNLDKATEYIEKAFEAEMDHYERRIDFTKGIALGLVFGIVGNLFVQFFYAFVEGIILVRYDGLFYSNLIVSVASLIIIFFVSVKFYKQLKIEERDRKSSERGFKHLMDKAEELRKEVEKLV